MMPEQENMPEGSEISSGALRKLNHISKIIGMAAKVLMGVLAVGIVVAFIFMIAVILDPDIIPDIFNQVSSDDLVAACATAVIGGCFGLFHLYYINHFFMNIHRNNTPFTDECVKDLHILAVLVVAFAIVMPLVSAAMVYLIGDGPYLQIHFDFFTLFVAFLIYVMALVFRYGTALQKESDETL